MANSDHFASRAVVTKAVILAAGRGTRMRELTTSTPKAMIEVWGKPILQHIIEGLRAASVRQLFIVVGWRGEVIKNRFTNGSGLGVSIEYGTQAVQDGTGKIVELARGFVADERFVLSYGDILVDPKHYRIITKVSDKSAAVVSVKRSENVTRGAGVFLTDQFEISNIRENVSASEQACIWRDARIYNFSPGIFTFTAQLDRSPRGEFELTDAIRNLAVSGSRVQAIEVVGDWSDVRDPEVLTELKAKEGFMASASHLAECLPANAVPVTISEVSVELIRRLGEDPQLMHQLQPRKFEKVIAEILIDLGFSIRLTPSTRDGGRDILATFSTPFGEMLAIVECKRWASTRKIGVEIVRRFLHVLREQDKANIGIIVTTTAFSSPARREAREFQRLLKLHDWQQVQRLASNYGKWRTSQDKEFWLPNDFLYPPNPLDG